MSMSLCPLASGSLGNALLVRSPKAVLLVDLGVAQKRLRAGLAAAATEPGDIDAVFLTHTHRDHFSTAAPGFCLQHNIPVYSARANLEHFARTMPVFGRLVRGGLARPIDGEPLTAGDVTVEAFSLPHDAVGECLGFRFTTGPLRRRRVVTVATDLGHVPDDAVSWFIDSTAVVLESNHDPDMLRESARPADLKARIAGPRGHLSNEAAAESLAEIVGRSHPGRVRNVVLSHLSRDCNTPALALEAQAHLARRSEAAQVVASRQFEAGPTIRL